MQVSIDKAGRIVVPKSVRDQFGLTENSRFDLILDGHAIRLEPVETLRGVETADDGLPLIAAVPDRELTDAQVSDTRDSLRR